MILDTLTKEYIFTANVHELSPVTTVWQCRFDYSYDAFFFEQTPGSHTFSDLAAYGKLNEYDKIIISEQTTLEDAQKALRDACIAVGLTPNPVVLVVTPPTPDEAMQHILNQALGFSTWKNPECFANEVGMEWDDLTPQVKGFLRDKFEGYELSSVALAGFWERHGLSEDELRQGFLTS